METIETYYEVEALVDFKLDGKQINVGDVFEVCQDEMTRLVTNDGLCQMHE